MAEKESEFIDFVLNEGAGLLDEQGRGGMKAFLDEIREGSGVKLTESKRKTQELRSIVGETLDAGQIRFLGEFSRFGELIKFFVEMGREFEARSGFVRMQHIGSAHESEIIANAIGVHNAIRGLVELLCDKGKSKKPLRDACQVLCDLIPKDEPTRKKLLDELRGVSEKVNELRTWFTDISMKPTTESLYPLVKAAKEDKGSWFKIYFEPRSSVPHLQLISDIAEGESDAGNSFGDKNEKELRDYIYSVKIFLDAKDFSNENESDENVKKERKKAENDIKEYMEAYDYVLEIGRVYKELVGCGYPNDVIEGQTSDKSIMLPVDSAKLEEHKKEMENNLKKWKDLISEAQRELPRLMLLDPKNFAKLYNSINSITEIIKKEKEPKYSIPHVLFPFLWQCFPDEWNALLSNATIDYYTIKHNIVELTKGVDLKTNDIRTKMVTMVRIVDTMREKVFKVKSLCDTPYANILKELEVLKRPTNECIFLHVLGKDATQNDIYMELVRIHSGRIHPSFVLTCDSETTKDEVKTFLDRLRVFPEKDFSVLHPGRLSRESREYLVDWVSKRYEGKTTVGRLRIVVRKTQGDELFGFVEKSTARKGDNYIHPQFKELENTIKLHKLTWYETGPLTGKTTHIQNQARKFMKHNYDEKRFVSISVAEGWKPSSFIQVVKDNFVINEGKFDEVFVHFNVSPYGPLEEFGVFLYNLLAWGIIADKSTGDMFYVGQNLEWYIAVEISAAPKDDDECPFNTIGKVKEAIPLVEGFFSPEKIEEIKFDTESEDFLYCLAGFALTFPETKDFPGLNKKRESNGIEIVSIVHNFKSRADITDKKGKFSIFTEDFIKFLGMFFAEGQPKTIAILTRLVKLVSDRYRALAKFCLGQFVKEEDMKLFQRFYNCLMFEMRQFTRVPLEAPTAYMLFQERGRDKQAFVMDLTDNNALEAETKKYMLFDIKKQEEIYSDPSVLYGLINDGFNIANAKELLEGRRYVLTPDFAINLLFMNQCLGAGQNIVLSGDTGTGKSELLETFAVLVNAWSSQIPDNLAETYKFAVDAGIVFDGEGELDAAAKRSAIIKEVKRVCEDPSKMVVLRDKVATFVKEHLDKYKLLRGSDFLLSIKETAEINDATKGQELEKKLKTENKVLKAFDDVWCCKTVKMFHKLQMHQRVTPEMLQEMVERVVQSAMDLKMVGNSSNLRVVAFIDECMSTSVMGLVKEILTNKTFNGVPLPENIMWVGASSRSTKSNDAHRHESTTGLEDEDDELDPTVRPLPESLAALEIKLSMPSPKQQEYFLERLVEVRGILEWEEDPDSGATKREREDVREAIKCGQEFLTAAMVKRVHPSIRDVVRCMDLYAYFRKKVQFLPTRIKGMEDAHMCALVLAVMIAYYSRVPEGIHREFVVKYREAGLPEPQKIGASAEDDPFLSVFKEAARNLYSNTAEVEEIAPTHSFLQNLFFTVVCIDAKIPLMIHGPPGCSKTLSFSIAVQNMKGAESPKGFYRGLSHVHPIRYQCSLDSADTEVEAVYKNAERLQSSFDEQYSLGQQRNAALDEQRCVVLLDEAGLPDERKAPLKVLHYKLDHPRVSSVILTNRVLDATKTNRAALLTQTEPTLDDLRVLTGTCIYRNEEPDESIVEALAQAYSDIIREQEKDDNAVAPMKKFFHIHNFVYLLRYLRKLRREDKDVINPREFARALKRNFGGVVREKFRRVVDIFGNNIEQRIPEFRKEEMAREAMGGSVLDTIQESMKDEIDDPQHPDNASFRDIIVIDPGNSEAAVSMVKKHLFPDGEREEDVRVIHVMDFSRTSERDGDAETNAIGKMRDAMGADKATVILINGHRISSSFYDLFSRHYDVLPDFYASSKEGEEKYMYFTNVSVGSISQPSRVSPNFRVIVHIPLSMLRQTPAPFLNRFKKYYVSLSDVLEKEISKIENAEYKNIVKYALDGCRQMINRFSGSRLLFGYVEGETLESIFINMVSDYVKTGVLKAPAPFQSRGFKEASPKQSPTKEYGLYLIREVMKCVIQTARPESMVLEMDTLPEDSRDEYFSHQEHFLVTEFMDSVFEKRGAGSKWCIFTKTSEVIRALSSENKSGARARESLLGKERSSRSYVFALEDVTSSVDWEQKMNVIKRNSIILCTVDMSVCTADQVNVVREYMNAEWCSGKWFFLVMHFPLELSVLHSYGVGQTIFADGWNYQYVDSLGLLASGGRVADTNSELVRAAITKIDIDRDIACRVNSSCGKLNVNALGINQKVGRWKDEWREKVVPIIRRDADDILRGEKHMGLLNNIGAMFNSFCFEKAVSLWSGCGIAHSFEENPLSSSELNRSGGGGVSDNSIVAVCERMDGSALFLAMHALHPLVSCARSRMRLIENQSIAHNMRELCGIELDGELEELGRQDISTLEMFVAEIRNRIEARRYLFKYLDIEYNENDPECEAKLELLGEKISCGEKQKEYLHALEELYEGLSLRYPYLHKHTYLFDLISRHYEAFSETSKALLDETFGKESELRTANYGQVMRWVSTRLSYLRKACLASEEMDEEVTEYPGSALPERYRYETEPIPLMIVDGVTSKNLYITVPWHHLPFYDEMKMWGYDPEEVEFVDPKTNEVADISKLKKMAYKNVLKRDYSTVVVAVKRDTIRDVYVINPVNGTIDERMCGRFWGTNVTIGDLKKKFNIEHLELIFNGALYDDHSTLCSLSPRSLCFTVHQIQPRICCNQCPLSIQPHPMDLIGSVIKYVEDNSPGQKAVLGCGCQPPSDMRVKDIVKIFGDWKSGLLNIYTTNSYVNVKIYLEEFYGMDGCVPIVDTYVVGSVVLKENFIEQFVYKLPRGREVYKRIANLESPLWCLEGSFAKDDADGIIEIMEIMGKTLLGPKNSIQKMRGGELKSIGFVLSRCNTIYLSKRF